MKYEGLGLYWLSLCPGLGHLALGRPARAAKFFLATLLLSAVFLPLGLGAWVLSFADARAIERARSS